MASTPTPIRRGIKTSEFLVTLVSLLGLIGTNVASFTGAANVTPLELSVFRLASLIVGGFLSVFYIKGRFQLKQAELLSAWKWFETHLPNIEQDISIITSLDPNILQQVITALEGLAATQAPPKANLGLASTEQLLDEVSHRITVSTEALPVTGRPTPSGPI